MVKRGRPARPPRTDPEELKKSRADLNRDTDARMAAVLGPMPEPKNPLAEKLTARAGELLASLKGLSADERDARLASWRGTLVANSDGDIAIRRLGEALEPPPVLTDEERAARLAQSRAMVARHEAEDAKCRRRKKKPDFNTQATRILPRFPQWIRDAAFDSILYLYDEAPESMRLKNAEIRPELEKARAVLMRPDMPPRLAKKAAALWDAVRCGAWAEGDILDPGPNGHRAAYIHYINVEDRVKRFAATCKTEPDGRVWIPRDVVLRLFAPAFNAVQAPKRMCLECGQIFGLRNEHERMTMRYCGGAKKCSNNASSRKAKAAERAKIKAAGDAYSKLRMPYKGAAALEQAEKELAHSNNLEDVLIDLIDAVRSVSEQK